MELEKEILEKLKCSQCCRHLSCFPIMLKKDGNSVCGRCLLSDDDKLSAVRNKAYEEISSKVLFPCRNSSDGCQTKVTPDHIMQHESTCQYHSYECPVSFPVDCTWRGSKANLEEHYRKNHSELIVNHPYVHKLNTSRSYEYSLLTTVFGILFIIQEKFDINTFKLWYCVHFLGDPRHVNNFKFVVMTENSKNNFITQTPVTMQNSFAITHKYCSEIDVKKYLSNLEKNADENFELRIIMENMKCSICGSLINSLNKGLLCTQCVQSSPLSSSNDSLVCKNKIRGCQYTNENANILCKHQLWFCKHRDYICWICKKDCCNRISPTDHSRLECAPSPVKCTGNIAVVTFNKLPVDEWKYYVIQAHNTTFLLGCGTDVVNFYPHSIWVTLTSALPDVNDTEKFCCKFKIFDEHGNKSEYEFNNVSHQYSSNYGCDWYKLVNPSTTVLKEKLKHSYNLELQIEKIIYL